MSDELKTGIDTGGEPEEELELGELEESERGDEPKGIMGWAKSIIDKFKGKGKEGDAEDEPAEPEEPDGQDKPEPVTDEEEKELGEADEPAEPAKPEEQTPEEVEIERREVLEKAQKLGLQVNEPQPELFFHPNILQKVYSESLQNYYDTFVSHIPEDLMQDEEYRAEAEAKALKSAEEFATRDYQQYCNVRAQMHPHKEAMKYVTELCASKGVSIPLDAAEAIAIEMDAQQRRAAAQAAWEAAKKPAVNQAELDAEVKRQKEEAVAASKAAKKAAQIEGVGKKSGEDNTISKEQKHVLKQLGISDKSFLKYSKGE